LDQAGTGILSSVIAIPLASAATTATGTQAFLHSNGVAMATDIAACLVNETIPLVPQPARRAADA
jgi:predicted RecA/RadA family phage recombinase